jgi:hypothetical protein
MIQAFSLIFNFFNIASPCSDMVMVIDGHGHGHGDGGSRSRSR